VQFVKIGFRLHIDNLQRIEAHYFFKDRKQNILLDPLFVVELQQLQTGRSCQNFFKPTIQFPSSERLDFLGMSFKLKSTA